METGLLLQNILLGGLLGLLGQGIRALAGLKKLSASNAELPAESLEFDTRRLWVSLFLGFIAGALGIVSFLEENGNLSLTKDLIITLIGIGYSGVDFIESFLTKYANKVILKPAVGSQGANANLGNNQPAHQVGLTADNPDTVILRVPQLPYSSK